MANALKIDLKGKVVVLSGQFYMGDICDRLFRCEDGFGCFPFTSGAKICGTFLADGKKGQVHSRYIDRLATEAETKAAILA